MRILQSFGVSYQTGALFGSMTVLENVLLPLEENTDLPGILRERISRMKLAQVVWPVSRSCPCGTQRRDGQAGGHCPGPWPWIPAFSSG
jgi:hypothetical protein